MIKNLEIRKLNFEDRFEYSRLNLAFIEEEIRDNPHWDPSGLPNESQLLKTVDFILKNHSNICVFVVVYKNRMIGFMNGYSSYSVWTSANAFTIDDLYIEAAYRGLGLGSQVMIFLEDYARKNNIKRLQLHAEENNTKAQEFYKRNKYIGMTMEFFIKEI